MGRTCMSRALGILLIASFMIVLTDLPVFAQTGEEILTTEAFLSPPDDIAQAVLAPRHENVSLSNRSPDGKYYLRTLSSGLPPMANYAKPFYRLAGTQIDPVANRSRRFTTSSNIGFELIEWETGNTIRVDAPEGAGTSNPAWSPDGTKIAYFVHSDDATHIWVYDVATGRARAITRTATLTTLANSFSWTEDSANIVAVLLPADREDEPEKSAVPTTPMVRVTEDGENKLRIYASLLENPHDAALLEYHTTGQLSIIDVARRRATPIGSPDMIRSFNISPDGHYLRVTRMIKPFSYIVPMGNFGTVEEIWDLQGNVLYEIQKRELRTGISSGDQGGGGRGSAGGGGGDDKRALNWRPDGQGMTFLQMEPRAKRDTTVTDEEPAAEEAEEEEAEPRKDRVMQWLAPFDSTSTVLVYESETRMSSVAYSADCRTLFITESEGGTRTVYAVYLDDPETRYTISEYKTEDYYANPGSLQSKPGPMGGSVIRTSTDGSLVYLSGTQSFEEWNEQAPKAFIDQVEIKTGEVERVYETPDGFSERVQVMDDDLTQLMVTRESPTQIGDSWLWTRATEDMRKMTNNVDHTPDLTNAVRDRFEVTRVDGVRFWVTVTLPADWREGDDPKPAMWWFYPREYTSQKAIDESKRRTNINSFPRISTRGMVILTRLDYAIVEPDCPIMGSEGALNDVFTSDLRNNLYAVMQALDAKGYVDTDRMAIGGHSYGAFGTAHAMIQTPFFRAGIAGDGNYNRLLTPGGFQSERRELWAAREIYLRMSPILWANELQGALLMYHGMHDQNTGTAPFHAPKMFHAMNDLGKTAALYMYPYEDHGPATMETNLDLWARWIPWLDRYVKNYKEYEVAEKEKDEEGGGRGRRGG